MEETSLAARSSGESNPSADANSHPAIASVRISAKERLARAAAMNRRRRRHDTLFLAHILIASSGLFFELSETLIVVQLVLMIVIFMAFVMLCLTEKPIDF